MYFCKPKFLLRWGKARFTVGVDYCTKSSPKKVEGTFIRVFVQSLWRKLKKLPGDSASPDTTQISTGGRRQKRRGTWYEAILQVPMKLTTSSR